MTLEAGQCTTNVSVQLGYQYSNDKQAWYSGAATPVQNLATGLGVARTSDGITYSSTFEDVTTSAKLYIRIVGLCKNSSGTDLELANMSSRLELRSEV